MTQNEVDINYILRYLECSLQKLVSGVVLHINPHTPSILKILDCEEAVMSLGEDGWRRAATGGPIHASSPSRHQPQLYPRVLA